MEPEDGKIKVDVTNCVNMAVCSTFKAYLGETDRDQSLSSPGAGDDAA